MGVFKLSRRASFLVKLFVYASFYALTIWVIVAPFFFEPTSGNNFPWLRSVVIFFASVLLAKYFFYMFLSPWHDVWLWIRYGRKLIDCKYHPKVSVVIPAWNEQVGILTTIKSLLNSTYKNLEVVVVNDGSTDASDFLIRYFLRGYQSYRRLLPPHVESVEVVYLYKENGGKGAALNTAIKKSTGDIIVSIDADCFVMPDAIANFVKYFSDSEVMVAVGNVSIGNR